MKNATLNGRPAMSEARRLHIHGPLVADEPATAFSLARWAICGFVFAVLTFLAFAYAVGPVPA